MSTCQVSLKKKKKYTQGQIYSTEADFSSVVYLTATATLRTTSTKKLSTTITLHFYTTGF